MKLLAYYTVISFALDWKGDRQAVTYGGHKHVSTPAFFLVSRQIGNVVKHSAASAREPILFVHGWSGAAWN